MAGYPIVLELDARRVVVVGLGSVGRRKAAGLVEAGALVVGIDPIGLDSGTPRGVVVVAEPYRDAHLDGAVLAFASATPEVNRLVVADARRRGILVNSATEPKSGDFALPAVWRDGPILLSVSTSGAGPALAATLRDRAALALGPPAAGYAALLAELHPTVLARVLDEPTRGALFRDWSHPRWLSRWQADGPDAVRAALLATIPDDLDDPADHDHPSKVCPRHEGP